MTRLAVLTSGGDAPGMNAAVRAVVRTAAARGFEVVGVRHGYTGLIAGEFIALGPREVGGIIDRGGTFLGTTRCEQMRHEAGQQAALEQLERAGISGVVIIGGNGSQAGSLALSRRGARVIGVASTIDNDLAGTDISIGVTTALDTALEAIDRLRDTASAHRRAFLVEVMGRHSGYLALLAGIAGGAEAVVIPEADLSPEEVADEVRGAYERGKSHAIVVVAEGARYGAEALSHHFREHATRLGFDLRVTRLGHVQRGGSPGAFDRLLATRLGAGAIEQFAAGCHGVLVGYVGGNVVTTELSAVAGVRKVPDMHLVRLARTLAR
jgi:6-phosphofructokinase 1